MSQPPGVRRRLLIRAAAGHTQGSGHVMRSLAVAEQAQASGMLVSLSADLADLAWLMPWVEQLGIEVLPSTENPDGLASMAEEHAASAVLLDHYQFEPAREAVNSTGALLVNFEDHEFGRRPADIVVDYSLGAETMARPDDGSSLLLRGVSFAPLRKQVLEARSLRSPFDGNVREVAVLMGGTDPYGLREIVAESLQPAAVKVATATPGLGFLDQVAEADAVITAAGSSAYEMCCLGMPIGLVQVADNQGVNYRRLIEASAATGLGFAEDLVAHRQAFATRVQAWLADAAQLSRTAESARTLLDGNGAGRIATRIVSACALVAD